MTVLNGKEIVQNGDFKSKRLEHWQVGVTKKYGQELESKVKGNAIHFENIKETSPKYVTLSQYIDLEENTEYTVSFDAKVGDKMTGKVTMAVGRPGFACPLQDKSNYNHLKPRMLKELGPEWKHFEFTFKTIYKTDNSEVFEKGFKMSKAKEKWRTYEKDPGIAPTQIIFNLGGMGGNFSLKSVKIEKVSK
ncbi:carbohydrate binding domain-containing protein [Rubritalea squalenifaciens]|nr:carbohydrate binding domain-containing protein [Rubritalea squalenifaciens]